MMGSAAFCFLSSFCSGAGQRQIAELTNEQVIEIRVSQISYVHTVHNCAIQLV